ncbi:MAG: aminotransferase class V-fold PLP-dependent enzyme [Bacillota bacterium]
MRGIYFDNAASSYPKAPGVGEAMANYIDSVGANISRASYWEATEAGLETLRLREKLCALFGFSHPELAVLTPGMTFGLNQALKGYLKPGDHAIVSSMEHNAMMRPLSQLCAQGVAFDRIPCDGEGLFDPCDVRPLIRPNTRVVAMLHASNVSGGILPVEEVGKICRERGIAFVLDAAQSAGHLGVDFEKLGLSALCAPGHKGLLGPQGIGAMLLKPEFAKQLEPLVAGGTGSRSDSEDQPGLFPDRFESGTLNLPGIYGLSRAIDYIAQMGVGRIHEREMRLCRRFLEGVSDLKDVRVLGPKGLEKRVAVAALDFTKGDNAIAASELERSYGIYTRCGLHCAPSAHKTLGSFPQGAVRFSFGAFNTEEQVDEAVRAVRAVSDSRK